MKISHPRVWLGLGCIAGLLGLAVPSAQAQNLADTIEKIKPSIVAIGTFQKTRRPPSIFRGTGFMSRMACTLSPTPMSCRKK
jgi:hypothetical protein